jgi:hypothetical protein
MRRRFDEKGVGLAVQLFGMCAADDGRLAVLDLVLWFFVSTCASTELDVRTLSSHRTRA